MMNKHLAGHTITQLFSEDEIQSRVKEIGREISDDYAGTTQHHPLHLVVVLKGAFIFAADLVRAITVPCTIDFIRASSYGSSKTSSGHVAITHNLHIEGKHILLVEDIIDSGLTMLQITGELTAMKPASMKICTLLDKPAARTHSVEIAYTGFVVPIAFIVGYGIDYDEHFRELPSIGVLSS
jgi:hypoxanthine phosphoribosyltransferase